MDKSLLKENRIHGDIMFPMEVYSMRYTHPNSSLDCHWHDELEFLYVTEGSATFQIETDSYQLSKGEGLFVNSGEVHAAFSSGSAPWGYYAVVFSADMLQGNSCDRIVSKYLEPLTKKKYLIPQHINGETDWQKRLLNKLEEMIEIYGTKHFTYELRVKACLYEMISELISHSKPRTADRGLSAHLYKTERFKKVLSFIQNNYSRKISLSELAQVANLSEGHFCRFFKQMANKSPVDYINYYKVNRAAKLLLESDMRIIDAAMEVGFDNFSYFTNIFKQYMHCTPSEYRKKDESLS